MIKAEAKGNLEAKPAAAGGSKAEAKTSNSANNSGDSKAEAKPNESAVQLPKRGTKLVHSLVEFSYRILHTELDGFFTENCSKFDQDWDEVRNSGVLTQNSRR